MGSRISVSPFFYIAFSVNTPFSNRLSLFVAEMALSNFRLRSSSVPTILGKRDPCLVAQVPLEDLIDSSSVMCSSRSNYYGWRNSENGGPGLVHGFTLRAGGKPVLPEHKVREG